MNPDDIIGVVLLFGAGIGTARFARTRRLERLARPRLCSCGHGSGPHGPDGCTQPRQLSGAERNELPQSALVELAKRSCGCLAFDASGPRAPR